VCMAVLVARCSFYALSHTSRWGCNGGQVKWADTIPKDAKVIIGNYSAVTQGPRQVYTHTHHGATQPLAGVALCSSSSSAGLDCRPF